MKTKAVRLYGKNDLRLEEFDLPEMREDEILAHIISNSICMSSHKAALQGADHTVLTPTPNALACYLCGRLGPGGRYTEASGS